MLSRLWCTVWGHAVDNEAFAQHGRACTRCEGAMLADDGMSVRLGHTLSCFLRHHTYREVVRRDGTEMNFVRHALHGRPRQRDVLKDQAREDFSQR